jgi:CrcB protein
VAGHAGRQFPYGTLLVNVLGAFVLGVLVGIVVAQDTYRLVATGLVGSFTTFSTWAFESHRLSEDDEFGLGALNFIISLILGIGAVWAGRHVGAAL